MDPLTPARAALRLLAEHAHRPVSPGQVSLRHAHIRHGHSVATHLMLPRRRFRTLPLSATRALDRQCRTSPLPSRLVGRTRPYRVRHPTDWSLTSACSPPRLAATQLPLVSGRRAYAWEGLPPSRMCALEGALGRRAKHADSREVRECRYKPQDRRERFVSALPYLTAGPLRRPIETALILRDLLRG